MDFVNFVKESHIPKVEKKDWMEDVEMALVTAEMLPDVIDQCIAVPYYGADLETTGLDNRVFDGCTVDHIVGVCLAPSTIKGYYIPLAHKDSDHNIPMSLFRKEFTRLLASKAVSVWHNAKFDLEFLEFNGGEAFGNWDKVSTWEDTLALAHLYDTRQKTKGLKPQSKMILDREMIELQELFPVKERKRGKLDFSTLDPAWEPVTWYAAADAMCTLGLFQHYYPRVVKPKKSYNRDCQKSIYHLEKACLNSIRWMERNRIHVNVEKVKELIKIGHVEYLDAIKKVYEDASKMVGRDIMPSFYALALEEAILDDPDRSLFAQIQNFKRKASRLCPDPQGTISKQVGGKKVNFPLKYDVGSSQQMGQLFQELDVPNLNYTASSGQVKTSKDELDRLVEENASLTYMNSIKKFREVQKALSTYLYPLYEDRDSRDDTIRINFNSLKVDTGRFSTPGAKDRGSGLHGGTRYNIQSTPATYDKSKPDCMKGLRECIAAIPGFFFAALDWSGVELRIATNLSLEPKWLDAFFECSACGQAYPKDKPPPHYCVRCGDDKVGDLHSLTVFNIFGKDSKSRKDFKQLRQMCKSVNFALAYGGSAGAVKRSTGCSDTEAWRIKRGFDESYKGLTKWWDKTREY
ncbi:MAG: DNA polymerase, partial [Bacteroidota bacterium]